MFFFFTVSNLSTFQLPFLVFPFIHHVAIRFSLRTLWQLFRKSTAALVREVLQPVLDSMVFPEVFGRIEITSLKLGESPALVRQIARIPSRALSEAQYRFYMRLVGDKNGYIDLRVRVRLPGMPKPIPIPVRLGSIDIDALVWVSVIFVPYPPWVRFVQWAFDEMPSVKFSIRVAGFLPVTSVPVLSGVLNRIVTKDVPREFVFPNVTVVDFMAPPPNQDGSSDTTTSDLSQPGLGVTLPENSTDDELRKANPELCSLFDGLDDNDDGKLSLEELAKGLVDWGFASLSDHEAILKLLDVNADGYIQLSEFLSAWKNLQAVFVPRRFRGVASGVLLQAEGLRTPFIGSSDLVVVFSCENVSTMSKGARQSLQRGEHKNCPVWNEVSVGTFMPNSSLGSLLHQPMC